MQESNQTSDMYWAGNRLGPTRLLGAYAWRALLATGVIIPNGSDFPVEPVNPLISFHASVSRQDEHNWPTGGWFAEQRMTREEALKSMTLWPAIAAFQETEYGSLAPGKLADFVVLDQDIMSVAPERILATRVIATYLAGRPVYEQSTAPAATRAGVGSCCTDSPDDTARHAAPHRLAIRWRAVSARPWWLRKRRHRQYHDRAGALFVYALAVLSSCSRSSRAVRQGDGPGQRTSLLSLLGRRGESRLFVSWVVPSLDSRCYVAGMASCAPQSTCSRPARVGCGSSRSCRRRRRLSPRSAPRPLVGVLSVRLSRSVARMPPLTASRVGRPLRPRGHHRTCARRRRGAPCTRLKMRSLPVASRRDRDAALCDVGAVRETECAPIAAASPPATAHVPLSKSIDGIMATSSGLRGHRCAYRRTSSWPGCAPARSAPSVSCRASAASAGRRARVDRPGVHGRSLGSRNGPPRWRCGCAGGTGHALARRPDG